MRSQKRFNVLITGAGGADTPLVIRSLKRVGGFRPILCDSNAVHGVEKLTRSFYRVPQGDAPHYLKEIEKIVVKESLDAIVPGVDEELLQFVSFRKRCPGVKVIMPDSAFVLNSLNKLRLNQCLAAAGIPAPRTHPLKEFRSVPKSFFRQRFVVKPVYGHGSRGLYYFQGFREAEAALPFLTLRQPDSILQERIEGTEYTVSVHVSSQGDLIDIIPKRVLVKKGITLDAVTERDDAVIRYCALIAKKLDPRGPFNVQLILDKKRQPYAFEINPRFSTTTVLTSEAGFDEIPIALLDFLGAPYKIPKWKEGVRLVRRWENLFQRGVKLS